MHGAFFLAARYILHHRWKTMLLVGCLAMTAFLPLLLWMVLTEFDRRIAARAVATPLVIGPRGSQVDLALHALYFSQGPNETIRFGEVSSLRETDLADFVPLHCRFSARGFPIVGTSVDYFDFRKLVLADGRKFVTFGECVIGSEVAKRLQLKVADKLMSDRENLVDIAGLYPLRMQVTGVLSETGTADDRAVFVDLTSSWIMMGLGHGHDDLKKESDPGKIIARDENKIVASAAVLPYLEITPELADSVHFHGDQSEFPITAILAFAPDKKSETLLIGRFSDSSSTRATQILVPNDVIRELMKLVFQVSQLFNANVVLVGFSTVCLFGLVIALSLRLRATEMETMFRLGCSRTTIFSLQAAELVLVIGAASVCVVVLVLLAQSWGGQIIERLIVG
jgi:putative ABC transport system permease protein